ncbi:MAG: hypothetical protein F6K47_15600 [Symploca sp. SIO2E6]|nr:hypothetical protein [Symploca sp. SIO2E6]
MQLEPTEPSLIPEAGSGLEPEVIEPANLRPLTQENSLLSLAGGKRLLAEATLAIETQDYNSAAPKLQQARQVFNQLSNFYQQLAGTFTGIDNRIVEEQRQKALATAEMRDEATYQLALVHRAQNKPELSVPLLVQIVSSQNPTRELGKQAYQQLFELGFTETSPTPVAEDGSEPEVLEPQQPKPLLQEDSLLSLPGGRRLIREAGFAIDEGDYSIAATKLQQGRQVFNQLSNFYQQLAEAFSGIDNRIASEQRQKALETAEGRDEATYQLALVHRAQNKPELSVPLLVQIVRSQNPTRELGKKAYQQLFELGFVDFPFPISPASQS